VVVNVTARPGSDADLIVRSGDVLTFTPANWNIRQFVIFEAAEDADTLAGEATFHVIALDLSPRTVTVREEENDAQTTPPGDLRLEIEAITSAEVTLRFDAVEGTSYTLQYCDYLLGADWQDLLTQAFSSNSTVRVSDTRAPRSFQRFYRLVAPSP
jgi:hypothetical protein